MTAFENLVYDFNSKFIPESSIKSVSKIFPLCFIQSFVSKEEEKLSKLILTKNYVNMEVPIDSLIIKERVSNTESEHSWNDSNSIRYFGPIISDMVSPEVKFLSVQSRKMVKHTQTVRHQIALKDLNMQAHWKMFSLEFVNGNLRNFPAKYVRVFFWSGKRFKKFNTRLNFENQSYQIKTFFVS